MTKPCEYPDCKHYKTESQYFKCYMCIHNTLPLTSLWRNVDDMTLEDVEILTESLERAKTEPSTKWVNFKGTPKNPKIINIHRNEGTTE